MITLLNSSKTLDMQPPLRNLKHTLPEFADESAALVSKLRKLSVAELAALMKVSEKLAVLNVGRYRNWSARPDTSRAKPSLMAFKGDVYDAMNVDRYTAKAWEFAQQHVRIISGLYGILRPLDLIQPYRLEMATQLSTGSGKNLYEFWGEKIHRSVKAALAKEKSGVLINLASLEYFKTVKADRLKATVITPVFKEKRGSAFRVVAIYAKKARGRMCDFIIQNRLLRPKDLKSFNLDGYRFQAELSSQTEWVFVRKST
ncbi:MAG: peroxide stress protein YaaA [Desulfobacterales bacterium]|nr:peroxide stress protein YaaA [Desulfobacterales bacterium]